MPVELIDQKPEAALPVYLVGKDGLDGTGLSPSVIAWARANGFSGEAGRTLVLPAEGGGLAGALFGTGDGESQLAVGALARALPEGEWHFAQDLPAPDLAALAVVLGGYAFTRYGKKPGRALRFALPSGADGAHVRRTAEAIFLTRDLVNT
ncbi:MAG: leucyl aminopeptidase family protein, partial [Mesorhizobium sp.]